MDRRPCRNRSGPGSRRPQEGGGAPPIRARAVAVPDHRAAGRSPGAHSPPRDRARGRCGPDGTEGDLWPAAPATRLPVRGNDGPSGVRRPWDRFRSDRALGGGRGRNGVSECRGLGHGRLHRCLGGGSSEPGHPRWTDPAAAHGCGWLEARGLMPYRPGCSARWTSWCPIHPMWPSLSIPVSRQLCGSGSRGRPWSRTGVRGSRGHGRHRDDHRWSPPVAGPFRSDGHRDRPIAGSAVSPRGSPSRLWTGDHRTGSGWKAANDRGQVVMAVTISSTADPDGMARAVDALRSGSVVALPTDTVYGLAVDPTRPVRWNGCSPSRGARRSLQFRCWSVRGSRWRAVTGQLGGAAAHLADQYWPGPLTLVVPRAGGFTADLGGPPSARTTVGVRWPDHPVVRHLCLELGPLAVTSANLHGSRPATSAREVVAAFSGADGLPSSTGGFVAELRPRLSSVAVPLRSVFVRAPSPGATSSKPARRSSEAAE